MDPGEKRGLEESLSEKVQAGGRKERNKGHVMCPKQWGMLKGDQLPSLAHGIM